MMPYKCLKTDLFNNAGIFEDFHAVSKGNLYSKIATPRILLVQMLEVEEKI